MKTLTLNLAAGPLVLGPLLAATIRDNKDDIKASRSGSYPPDDMLCLTARLAHAAALRVNPAITLADVESLVDMENFGAVYAACWGISVPEAQPELGEAPQAVTLSPSS